MRFSRSPCAILILLQAAGCASRSQPSPGAPEPGAVPEAGGIPELEARAEDALVQLGVAYQQAGRLEEARALLERVTRQYPGSEAGAAYLGFTLEEMELFGEARSAYERYLSLVDVDLLRTEIEERLPFDQLEALEGNVVDVLTRLDPTSLEAEIVKRIPLLQRREVQGIMQAVLGGGLAPPPPGEGTVAVLPFAFRGDDPQYEPLARALTDLVGRDLARLGAVEVVSGVQVQALVRQLAPGAEDLLDPATAAEAARLLGTAKVVQGVVEGQGGALDVLASVVEPDGLPEELRPLVAEGDAAERIFQVEKNLVRSVFGSMGIDLSPQVLDEIAPPETLSLDALLEYGKGLVAEDSASFLEAAEHFARAVGIDPGFQLAQLRQKLASAVGDALEKTARELAEAAAGALLGGPEPLAGGEEEDRPGVEDAAAAFTKLARWEFNGFVGLLNDEPEFNPDEPREGEDQFRRDAIVGLRTGYIFGGKFITLLEVSNSLVMFDTRELPRDRDADSWWFGTSVGYTPPPLGPVQLFPVVGAGVVTWDVENVEEAETDFSVNYGLGARYIITPRLAVRWDARMHQVPQALLATRRRLGTVVDEGADLFGLELSIGVSFHPG